MLVTDGIGDLCCAAGGWDQTVNLTVDGHAVSGANLGDLEVWSSIGTGQETWHFYPYGWFGVDTQLYETGSIDLTFTHVPLVLGVGECCAPLPPLQIVPFTLTGQIDVGPLHGALTGTGTLEQGWIDYGSPYLLWRVTHPVPEPSTALLLLCACLFTGLWRWWRST